MYPNIPPNESDTNTLLIARMLYSDTLIFLKRTTHLCEYSPLLAFNRLRPGETDVTEWRQTQERNKAFYELSIEEALKTERVEGGSSGHYMEDSALRFLGITKMPIQVYVVHPNPKELMPGGIHVIPGVTHLVDGKELPGWYGTARETFDAILDGRVKPSIVQRAS
jgi:hypothetical protein